MLDNFRKILLQKKFFIYIILLLIFSFFLSSLNENKFKTQATVKLPNIYIENGVLYTTLENIIYDVEFHNIWFIRNLDIKIEQKLNIPKECLLIKKFNPNTFIYAKSDSILGLSVGYNKGYNLFFDTPSRYLLINFVSHNKDLNEMCVNTLISNLDFYLKDRMAAILYTELSLDKKLKKYNSILGIKNLNFLIVEFEVVQSTQSFIVKESKITFFFIYFLFFFLLSLIILLFKNKIVSIYKFIVKKNKIKFFI